MLSFSEFISRSSSLSMEKKLFAIFNWVFQVLDFLRLFVLSFNSDLILLRWSSTDSVLFVSALLLFSI